MKLGPGEPPAGPWRVAPIRGLVRLLFDAARARDGRPWILAVDGRSGSGKSTAAALLQRSVPASAIVHTDDVAWHHSFFDWSDLLVEGILKPLRNGRAVSYRPPGWDKRGSRGDRGGGGLNRRQSVPRRTGAGNGARPAPSVDRISWFPRERPKGRLPAYGRREGRKLTTDRTSRSLTRYHTHFCMLSLNDIAAWESRIERTTPSCATAIQEVDGRMFWLTRNRFFGSYLAFTDPRRL